MLFAVFWEKREKTIFILTFPLLDLQIFITNLIIAFFRLYMCFSIILANIAGIIKIMDISNSAWPGLLKNMTYFIPMCQQKLPLLPQRWLFALSPFTTSVYL